MKLLKRLLIVAIIFLGINVYASNKLEIESKSYDENKSILDIDGSSDYSEVMVSLFDGDNLLSFKTVTSDKGKFNASFNISFSEDKEITIKVGDINSSDYDITTLKVKKSIEPVKSNILIDDGGNSLKILDNLKKFDENDHLNIEIIDDFSDLDANGKAAIEEINKLFGQKKKLAAIMKVYIINNGKEITLADTNKGYELFLKLDEADLKDFKSPHTVRILDTEKLELDEGQKIVYDSKTEGATIKINNIGVFLLYDDISVDYKCLDKTDDQVYNPDKDDTLVIKVDADFKKFVAVYMDGELVDSKYYKAESGSTIITFTKEFLKSLKPGSHQIMIDFTDGQANSMLEIKDTSSSSNPQTGDVIIKYILIFALSGAAIFGGSLYLKKNKKTRMVK